MPRPVKCRRVNFFPAQTHFKPSGKKKCETKEIILKIEELEAMRLKDNEGYNQEKCAKEMEVSRQTFQNIIESARKKVATALINGYAINISGGDYISKNCSFKCLDCNEIYGLNKNRDSRVCPNCGSENVVCKNKNKVCHRHRKGKG